MVATKAEPTATAGKAAKAAPKPKAKREVSAGHKAALAQGREHGNAVKAYLIALANRTPVNRRGRPFNPERTRARLETIREALQDSNLSPTQRLLLIQEEMDRSEALARHEAVEVNDDESFEAITAKFLESALPYSVSKSISYSAWRKIGVPKDTLKAAGIHQS